MGLVQVRLGVKVSYSTTLRRKKQAANEVRGNPEESFMLLPSYLHMLEKMDHGTITQIECDEENKFKYIFFASGECIEGFNNMRKVIIVDKMFLRTTYGGVLIVATAQDPHRHHYPIAFGVVDAENDASWRWFLNMLKKVMPDDPKLMFVSDRNASIIKTICEVYPISKHGYYIFHLSQNVKTCIHGIHKKLVAEKFRECVQAYTEADFERMYDAFKTRYPKAADYLNETRQDVRKWARYYFSGERYNIDTTNCVESINAIFREARKYSLLPMIDAVIRKVVEWFNNHRKASNEVSHHKSWYPLLLVCCIQDVRLRRSYD